MGEKKHDEKGLSARYLVLVFLMGVAACAVFFSLGFLVGYNERPSRATPLTEHVTPSGTIPPTINPPLENVEPTGNAPPVTGGAAEEAGPRSSFGAARGAQLTPTPADASAPSRLTSTRASKAASAARSAPTVPSVTGVGKGFTVQVAASQNREDAQKLFRELKARGFAVFILNPDRARPNDNLFRVQVGPFASREQAEKIRAKIAQEGFKPFIKH